MTDGTLSATTLLGIIHQLIAVAWRRRYLIVVPMLLMPPLGALVGMMAPKQYETRMSVVVQDMSKSNPYLQDMAVNLSLKQRMPSLEQLLRSRHVLTSVVRDLELIPADAAPERVEGEVRRLASSVGVRLVGDELIELRYSARQPEGMDRVLSAIGHRFLERVVAPEGSTLGDSVRFLEQQLDATRNELDTGERGLSAFKAKHSAELPDLHAGNVTRLAQMRQILAERRTNLAGARSALASARDRLVQTNPIIGRLEEKIVNVQGDLALLRARYTDEHSEVIGQLRLLGRLQEERQRLLKLAQDLSVEDLDRIWNMALSTMQRPDAASQPLLISQLADLKAVQARVASLEREVASMEQEADELSSKVTRFGEVDMLLRTIERDVQAKRDLYQQLLKKTELARVTQSFGAFQAPERIKLIDRAIRPTVPTRPMVLVFLLLGVVGGLVLGVGLAVVAELTDSSLRSRAAAERVLGLPVIARIPPLPNPGFLIGRIGLDFERIERDIARERRHG